MIMNKELNAVSRINIVPVIITICSAVSDICQ